MATARKSKRLKIGLVIDTSLDSTEGVPQYVLTVGRWLSLQGHEVHYLAGETKRTDLTNLHSLARNVTVSFNGMRTTIPLWASRRRLRSFMRDEKFDVLHVQTPHHPFLAQRLMLAAGPHTAVIGTFHVMPYGQLSKYGNKLLGYWLRPSLKRLDTMLAVSPAAADYCRWSFGITARVLPNAIDYDRFYQARPLSKYQGKTLTVLFLGKLVPRKGCKLLLEAVNLMAKTDLPNFRVVICGRGPLEHRLKSFVSQNKLEDIVQFAGFVSEEDKPGYFASADIAAFPSSGGESFGIVLIEAMANGHTLVLAGENAGYRSVLGKQSELLFDPKDPAILAEKLQTFLTNPQLRQQLANKLGLAAKSYDINMVGARLEAVYHQTLRKRQAS